MTDAANRMSFVNDKGQYGLTIRPVAAPHVGVTQRLDGNNLADLVNIFGNGTPFSHTYYFKFFFEGSAGATITLCSIGNKTASSNDWYTEYVMLSHVNATDFKLYFASAATVFVNRESIALKYADYVGKMVELVVNVNSATATTAFYLNDFYGVSQSTTGTLIHPSAYLDGGREYRIQVTPSAYVKLLKIALWKANGYNIHQCRNNFATASLKYEFNEGSGDVLINTGTAGNDYDIPIGNKDATYWDTIYDISSPGFKTINGLRKCCTFDGSNDIARTAHNLYIWNLSSIFGTALPYTIYAKFKLNSDTGTAAQFLMTVSRTNSADYYRVSYGLSKVGTSFRLYFSTTGAAGATQVRETTTLFSYSSYVGTMMTVAYRIDATTGACKIYLNGTEYDTTATGTLLLPMSAFPETGDYSIAVGGRYIDAASAFVASVTFITLATFNYSYTSADCEANMDKALVKYLFNEGNGTILYNSGVNSGRYNLICTNTTAATFHTLIKE